MDDNKIVIAVTGPAKSGKSVILAEIARMLNVNQITFKHSDDSQLVLDGQEAELLSDPAERGRRIGIIKANGVEVVLEERLSPRIPVDA